MEVSADTAFLIGMTDMGCCLGLLLINYLSIQCIIVRHCSCKNSWKLSQCVMLICIMYKPSSVMIMVIFAEHCGSLYSDTCTSVIMEFADNTVMMLS